MKELSKSVKVVVSVALITVTAISFGAILWFSGVINLDNPSDTNGSSDEESAETQTVDRDQSDDDSAQDIEDNNSDPVNIESNSEEEDTNQTTNKDPYEDWKTYENDEYGVSLKYPPNWKIETDTNENPLTGKIIDVVVYNDMNVQVFLLGLNYEVPPALSGETKTVEPLATKDVDSESLYVYDCADLQSDKYDPGNCKSLYNENLSEVELDTIELGNLVVRNIGVVNYKMKYGLVNSDSTASVSDSDMENVYLILGSIKGLHK